MADIFPESREEEILVSMIDGEEYNKAPESRIEALLLELKEVIEEGGGGGGTTNYNFLSNKPEINGIILAGDKSSADLSIPTAADLAGKQDVLPVAASGNDVVFNGDIQDGQGNTLSVLAEALTKTAIGNPIVITDAAGGKARSLKTAINAIQDLHGYDKPWVGGAGKNKLPTVLDIIKSGNTAGTWSGNKYTYNGVVWEIKTDDAGNITEITANGTASGGNSRIYLSHIGGEYYTITLPSGDYIVNGCPTGGSISTYYILFYKTNTYTEYYDTGSGALVTYSSPLAALLGVNSGTTANNLVFKPMIRLSTESDATFAPYSNECPISGRTAAVITRSDGDEISEDFTIQLGQTVYGADINWDTGVMTIDKELVIFDGSNDENWQAVIARDNYNMYCPHPNVNRMNINKTQTDGISNRYIVMSGTNTWNKTQGLGIDNTSGYIRVYDTNYNTNDVTAWKTYLLSNPLQLLYYLATPTTIQLTPTQLELLKGYNRVTIDNGTITLDYIAKAISGNDEEIAPLVGDKATKAYAVNDFIERADGLYRVTAPIASGASFTANNTVKMSIGEALTYLYNK